MNENESCIHESEFVWTLGGHPIHDKFDDYVGAI
jgi:hypothetical protein